MTLPDWHTLGTALVVGIALGSIYSLVAISFNLVLAACGVFNLAISAVITVSVIVSYELGTVEGWHPLLALIVVITIGGLGGAIAEFLGVRRILAVNPKDVAHDTMVSTLGLGMAINALAAIIFGTQILPVDPYVSPNPIVVSGIPIRPVYIVMTLVGILVAVAIELLLKFTEFGVVTRAVIASNEGASLMGISVMRVVQTSFIASGAMAAVVGFLVAPVLSASAFVGESIMLFGFAAIAIGGFASFRGAIAGGMIVGLILGVTPAFVDPTWRGPLIWVAMIMVLFIRPAGLFGKSGQFGASSVRQV